MQPNPRHAQTSPEAFPVFALDENIAFFDEQMWAADAYSASWRGDADALDMSAWVDDEEVDIDEIDYEL